MKRFFAARWGLSAVMITATLFVAGCGGGGSSPGGEADRDRSDLVLIDVNVGGNDGVALNQIIAFEFSEEVVGSTVSPETIRIRIGPNFARQVPGEFNISGNIVEFAPRLPTAADLSNSGLLPGSSYEITLPGYPKANTLENAQGDRLRKTVTKTFATAIASSANLFIDYTPDETPHVVAVNPKPDAVDVPQAATVELTMNEPMHPASVNTSNIELTLIERPPGTTLVPSRPIQGTVVLEQSRNSVIIRFVPLFPLADNARYILTLDRRVTDLVGNDITPFTSFFTLRDEPPVAGSVTLGFGPGSEVYRDDDETTASWNDFKPGTLSGIFTAAGGDGTDGDFEPVVDTTLNANAQAGGVFNFRSFTIPSGVTVRVTGSVPAVILSLKSIAIEGVLDASGNKGVDGESASGTSKVPATKGGAGNVGGGKGGDVNTKNYTSNAPGGSGAAGIGTTVTGGKGALAPLGTAYGIGGGGGGGGHMTKGKTGRTASYTQSAWNGKGGIGGGTGGNSSLSPATAGGGGGAGSNGYYFSSPWNQGGATGGGGGGPLRLQSAGHIVITGEILVEGGEGGRAPGSSRNGGAGGGGAGGAFHGLATLDLIVESTGKISAAGGKGGSSGGAWVGTGGDGGNGWVRLEDSDGAPQISGKVTPTAYGKATFAPMGAGAPSFGQTLWLNTGVFDPFFNAPTDADIVSTIPKAGQTMTIEIKMSPEDVFDIGNPDEDLESAWVLLENIQTLNGNSYQFFKLRVTFNLASDQTVEDPLPFLDSARITYIF